MDYQRNTPFVHEIIVIAIYIYTKTHALLCKIQILLYQSSITSTPASVQKIGICQEQLIVQSKTYVIFKGFE